MQWLTQTSKQNESFSWGDYHAHKSGDFWAVYKLNPFLRLGRAETKRQAAEVCKGHKNGYKRETEIHN